ncbi:MAG: 3-hydroxyisobutyrate dehydrogenase-like beta-hydroxyacid dehydrogenase [Parvicella sp.]|jgi:3-hydroxyisobutyrate dehydrogenase-like beta-hydroxyacid dehydrogenase
MSEIKVAFLGLGVMGAPMAGHLAKGGCSVKVYNRNTDKAKQWVEGNEGSYGVTPIEAIAQAQYVMMCLGNDHSVRETLIESGAIDAMREGTIVVDHTTTSAIVAREMAAECEKRNLYFLDAPVSGGQAGAENGQLAVMVGGDARAFEQVEPIIGHYSKATTLLGDSGAGQLTKMVNQICIAGLVQGLSEGLAFSEKAGLDTKQVLSVISKGAAQSWQMENRGETMVDDYFDYGFAVDHMRKDLGLCLDQAKMLKADMPITTVVNDFYGEVQKMNGRWDTSSLIKRLGREIGS